MPEPALARDLPALIGAFYEAALQPEQWTACCAEIARHTQASSSILFIEDRAAGTVLPLAAPEYSPAQMRDYAAHYHARDPFAQAARSGDVRGAVLGQALVPAAAFARSELWNDFIAKSVRSFHFLCGMEEIAPGLVFGTAVHRPPEAQPFEEADRQVLAQLLPHLRRALQLAARLDEARLREAAQTHALTRAGLGLIVCDGQGRLVRADPAAEALCQTMGLALPGKGARLELREGDPAGLLARLIHATAAGDAGGEITVATRHGQLGLLVCPLPASLLAVTHLAPGADRVLVLLRPARPSLPNEAALRLSFGFTPAEAAVARALALGATGAALSASRGVAVTTIRSQIRDILAKTGAANLRDLNRVLTASGG